MNHIKNDLNNDILNSKILIIEDDYLGRVVLREIFRRQGFIHIEEAENGIEGLTKIQSFRPDLVILDIIMPEMGGMECCKLIRQNSNPQIANVPILVQTALARITDKARMFEVGASDYITKPIDPHEITARAIVHLEREIMTRHLREYNARMAQELDVARITQQVLFPSIPTIQKTEEEYSLKIYGHHQSSSELGGDFWGFRSLSKDEIAIYILDFSGHGVNAALNVFRLHALMQSANDTANNAGAHLTHLNSILTPLLPIGQFATMFYGIINIKNNMLSYASAAAPPPMLFNEQGKTCQMLEAGGTLLGAFKETIYQSTEIPFNANDCLLLYSDALFETVDNKGDIPSIESWAENFQAYLQSEKNDCQKAFSALLADFQQIYAPNLNDDLTLNAYFRCASPEDKL
jgi:sigma-B regulation protein RsbU (phosphoserine phosphatase)